MFALALDALKINLNELHLTGILRCESSGSMNDIKFPVQLLGNPAQRAFLARATGYVFVLFCILPLVTGLALPYVLGLTDHPSASLPMRTMLLVTTGGISFLIALIPAFLLVRVTVLSRLDVFLLFPAGIVSLVVQTIMYREFGTEIDDHLLGLFQGNLSALWVFGREKYHIDWAIAAVVVLSLVLTWWVCRNSRARWTPSPGVVAGVALGFLATGSIAFGMRSDLRNAEYYHPSKLSSAPLYQVVAFAGRHWMEGNRSGYRGILEKTGEVATASDYEEITRRLGQSPEEFCQRSVVRPTWLRRQPSHVFLFLMESMEYDLLKSPDLKGLAPGLVEFAREGLSVPNFHASSGATIDAMHAMISGAAIQRKYPLPRKLARLDRIDTLPRIMKQAGYTPVFYAASRGHISSKRDSCEAYGYDRFIGCPDVAGNIRSNEWGVSDGDFFQWARGELGGLESPHFVTFLNVSNHPPHNAPLHELGELTFGDDTLARFVGKSPQERANYAGHVKYADVKLTEMARWLKEKYPDSLIVFTGDHCGNKVLGGDKSRVPFILWNDRVIDPAADTSSWFGAHMDIPATLASLVLPEGSTYRTLGQPVWSSRPGRVSPAGRVVVSSLGDLERKIIPATSDPEKTGISAGECLLRGSAIDALSWGYLNESPLVGQPPVIE